MTNRVLVPQVSATPTKSLSAAIAALEEMPAPHSPEFAWLMRDMLISVGRALSGLDLTEPESLVAFDRITAEVEETQQDFFTAALCLEETVTPEHVALSLYGLMHNFYERGAEQIPHLRAWADALEIGFEAGTVSAQLLVNGMRVAEAFAHIHLRQHDALADHMAAAVTGFEQLARALESIERFADAAVCAEGACNLIGRVSDLRYAQGAQQALTLSLRAQDHDAIGRNTLRMAGVIGAAMEFGEASKLVFFDALERSFFWLPVNHHQRAGVVAKLKSMLHSGGAAGPGLGALRTYWSMVNDAARWRRDATPAMGDPTLLMQPIVDLEEGLWLSSLRGASPLVVAVENARLALAGNDPHADPVATWDDWSIEHAALGNAVPHHTSILRAPDLDDLLMDLKHEVTHVVSMLGDLGVIGLVLRAVGLLTELALWTHEEPQLPPLEELLRRGVVPLDGPNLFALPRVEQSLEVSRKLQIVIDLWEPWLEGVALLSELADDPVADELSESLPTTVLRNLVDEACLVHTAHGAEFDPDTFRGHRDAAELRYQHALEHRARARLRDYLTRDRSDYLAGYLTVRALISTWRQTLARPLSGAVAARILLHATRFGANQAIPNLALPLDTFAREAERRLCEWVASLSRATAEELGQFERADVESRSLYWRDGRLIAHPLGSAEDIAYQRDQQQRLIAEASRILRGTCADPERVVGADAGMQLILSQTADLLAGEALSQELLSHFFQGSAHTMNALPLGSVSAPFWLNRKQPAFFVMVRTSTEARDTRLPSYDGLAVTLDAEKFAVLEREVTLRQARRMTVTRVVELTTGASKRPAGDHYLVFECGEFLHIQARGCMFGSTHVDAAFAHDIESRCKGSPLQKLEADFYANGQAGARRTLDWLSTIESWDVMGIDVTPWAKHVAELAKQVLGETSPALQAAASRRLLATALGSEVAADVLQTGGLEAILGSRGATDAAIALLDASGRAPAALPAELMRDRARVLFSETPLGWDVSPGVWQVGPEP